MSGFGGGSGNGVVSPRCVACGDLIGVYEPGVWVIGEIAHTTSRAADPELTSASGPAFHQGCFHGF